MPSSLVIYPSRLKLLRSVLAGVAFTALFVVIYLFHNQWNGLPGYWYYVSFGGMPVGAMATLYWLYRLIALRPALIINREGITDRSSLTGVGLIRWDEIAHLGLIERKNKGGRMTLLGVKPRDITTLMQRQNALTRLNEWSDGDLIKIGDIVLPMRAADLLRGIEQYYRTNIAPNGGPAISFDYVARPAEQVAQAVGQTRG